MNTRNDAVVDEVVETRNGDIKVYVSGDIVQFNSPPEALNETMLQYGYAYVDWIASELDDSRSIFKYVETDSI